MNIVDIKEEVTKIAKERLYGHKKSLYEHAEESRQLYQDPLGFVIEINKEKSNKEKSNKEKNLLVIDLTITNPLLIREYLHFLSEKEENI